MDLTETFGELREDIKLYLIDHHRPMRYENARHDQVFAITSLCFESMLRQLGVTLLGARSLLSMMGLSKNTLQGSKNPMVTAIRRAMGNDEK